MLLVALLGLIYFSSVVNSTAFPSNEITSNDYASGDQFGFSVSIDGTTVIVGADGRNSQQGAAYIFDCPTPSTCTQASELVATDGTSGDYFGNSVSISGTTAIVAAVFKNNNQGAAYIFDCTIPSNCVQASELVGSDGAEGDQFGQSVSISGTTVIVGAYGRNSFEGAAYIFSCPTPSNCTQTAELVASDGASGDHFGSSVSISGTTAIVAAYLKTIGSNSQQGAAYIFTCPTPANCTQASELLASDGASTDFFGWSVSISGTTAIVGAAGTNFFEGAAYIFDCPTPSTCTQASKLLASDGASYNFFGSGVGIDGTIAIVGAYQSFAAYIFTCVTPSTCTQASELLGSSVSISGTTAIVSEQGAVEVVDLSSIVSTPTPNPTPSSSGGFAGSFSGSVSGTINLKSCSVYLNGASLSGYAIVDSQNNNKFCCLQKGVINGPSCVRGSCASNPIAFGTFATITGDSTDCLVDCISSNSSAAQNSVSLSVLSATSGSIYAGASQSIPASPSQGFYLVLNGAYIPVYYFFVGNQQYACLIQGQYDGSSTCHYNSGCNAPISVTINFFYYSTFCFITCYSV